MLDMNKELQRLQKEALYHLDKSFQYISDLSDHLLAMEDEKGSSVLQTVSLDIARLTSKVISVAEKERVEEQEEEEEDEACDYCGRDCDC